MSRSGYMDCEPDSQEQQWAPIHWRGAVNSAIRLEAVQRVRPKIHCFGHIHHSYGMIYGYGEGTTFINASACNEQYQPVNKPVEIEI